MAVDKLDLQAIPRSLGGVFDDPVCPQFIHAALVAMQEDPTAFAHLHQELIDEWQPSTPTLRKLVLRLAYLIWRQERAQRSQDGMMLCRMEKEMGARTQRMLEAVSAPAEMVLPDATEAGGLRQAAPSEAKFDKLLDWLWYLIALLDARDFSGHWELTLKQIYGTKPTWRAESITEWARQLAHYFAHAPEAQTAGEGGEPTAEPSDDQVGASSAPVPTGSRDRPQPTAEARYGPELTEAQATQEDQEDDEEQDASAQDDDAEDEYQEAKDAPEGWEPPRRAIRTAAKKDEVLRKLRRELAAEHRDVATEYQLYRALNIDFPWYLRSALFAPQDKYWGTVIWQEQALGQQIESTLRMILRLKGQEEPQSSSAHGASRRRPGARPA